MTTSTELAVHAGGALAVGADQTAWTEQQLAVLRSAGVSEEVTPAELDAFLHECQRTRLDPFSKQIYLIGRYDSQLKRKVFRSQTGIDGYRVVAHRVVREDRTELEYEDTVWCGPDGEWRDVWLGQNPPAAAKVVVYKGGKRYSAVATLEEYAARYPDGNPYPMWRRMPANQLEKCAEAKALRRAFPNDLGGIYTAEEMEQADARDTRPTPTELTVEQAAAKMHRNQQPGDDPWTSDPTQTPAAPRPSTHGQRTKLVILVGEKRGISDSTVRHALASELLGREITSFKDLTFTEAHQLIERLEREPDHIADAEVVAEPVQSEPNPRNGDTTMPAETAAALNMPNLSQLVAHAAETNTTVGALLYTHITMAQNPQELKRLFDVAVLGRDNNHISPDEFKDLDELGRAANQDMATKAKDDPSWSHQRLNQMTAAGA